MYYIYIIRCYDNSLYTGITKGICKRMKEHYYKTKGCAKYTRAREVVSLESLWVSNDRSSASKLEYKLKQLKKYQKENIILNPKLIDESIYQYQQGITLAMCLDETEL